MTSPGAPGVRLAELVASLSLATDLGLGLPQEHVLRQTVIAGRLARLAGLTEDEQASVFYVSLLAWVGCVADSHELAHWFDDDRQIRADSYEVDKVGMPMMRMMLGHVAADSRPLRRITMVGRFLTGGFREAMGTYITHCQTTGDIADRLALDAQVGLALAQAFERWDGKGFPGTAAGTDIQPVMRVVQLADDAEVFLRTSGIDAVLDMLRSRRGTEFDPELVDLAIAHAEEVFAGLDEGDAWEAVLDGAAGLDRRVSDDELDRVLEIFADYADLKSPWYLGHSRAVADLVATAATGLGLSADDVVLVRRAALAHRLGAIGVSTGTWNKTTPLSAIETERIRTVPYLTERILSRQPRLAAIGAVAAMAHERTDGSGYPRALGGASLPATGKLLAAADLYQTWAEDRPDRPALTGSERERALLAEVDAGRLDGDCVRAVLTAAGHAVRRRATLVAGLTRREAEVLTLLVRGYSNKQIAEQLTITPRTAASHIEHIFTKTGSATRGAAAMFALRHGLVDASAAP
ncbi:HD domain-containing protein [Nocardioides marmoriginsengisoli]|uniref:HD domain-containing protein n=1 Tax=Nocardioides marmoriginsengisoli TaxID=661483 RepID=A0A3N0CK10_9ACTN|nr:HD domain-containing phosphohydrolase [Nocardioides marmoriginsengisoli]RNL63788.1 HD domain-containing protein [Nocardioides marmoriginsengisoli]